MPAYVDSETQTHLFEKLIPLSTIISSSNYDFLHDSDSEEINDLDKEEKWEPIKIKKISNYEICNKYPYKIRRIDNKYVVHDSNQGTGYIRVKLNRKDYLKHVIVANQFIINDDPEHKTHVDHMNQNKLDYRICNLRWVTPSENNKNCIGHGDIIYEYVNELPEGNIPVKNYNSHTFTDYYYHDNNFYHFNGVRYRKLHVNIYKKTKSPFVYMMSDKKKLVRIFLNKFKNL